MSRPKPSDAFTRFTSSTPHAMTRPSPTQHTSQISRDPSTTPSNNGRSAAAPPNETPQEKVARLRAAARLAKERGNLSAVDRFLVSGRRWADNVHRFATYSLIAFTGVSSVVAVYGISSLVAHNRRQKRAWIEREMDRLHAAQQAFLRGDATAEQLHLLEQERAGEEMAAAYKREKDRKKAEGIWSRMKGVFSAKVSSGEMGRETAAERELRETRKARSTHNVLDDSFVEGEIQPVGVAASGIKGVGVDAKGRPVPANKVEYVARKVDDQRRTGEREVVERTPLRGGPLDALAGNVAAAVTPAGEGGGWFSWLKGSKS